MNPDQIRAAIAASPALQEHAAAGRTQPIADALSVERTRLGMVTTGDFAVWAVATGMRAKIEDLASSPISPLRASALALRDVLAGGGAGIDLAVDGNRQVLVAWKSSGALSQVDFDSLMRLATKPDPISADDVWQAICGAK